MFARTISRGYILATRALSYSEAGDHDGAESLTGRYLVGLSVVARSFCL